ncbi:unnamed protein product [Rotaria magnacalcarata]|uniref:Uncharacterized protein n=1 Tax=Rotaria magnacalcarata TaxID=392030 RepID=A0A815M9I9_9BILA|nr:unnamed protein product [Rotaria magnacalcarata]CAF2083677.1 unnamed protein product [Rotaria magnacalcarata]
MYQNIDDDDDIDPYQASSFYGFSFIELSDSSEDSWSVNSSNTVSVVNTNICDEIKTCVETLNTYFNQFRGMNDRLNKIMMYTMKLMKMLILF